MNIRLPVDRLPIDFTPGNITAEQLRAALKDKGAQVDAAINSAYAADAERYTAKIEQTGGKPYLWEKTS